MIILRTLKYNFQESPRDIGGVDEDKAVKPLNWRKQVLNLKISPLSNSTYKNDPMDRNTETVLELQLLMVWEQRLTAIFEVQDLYLNPWERLQNVANLSQRWTVEDNTFDISLCMMAPRVEASHLAATDYTDPRASLPHMQPSWLASPKHMTKDKRPKKILHYPKAQIIGVTKGLKVAPSRVYFLWRPEIGHSPGPKKN